MAYRSPFNAPSIQTTAYKQAGKWKCGFHTGTDRVCKTDRTLVAIADATVLRVSGCGADYGNHIVYRTADGMAVLYGHMAAAPKFKPGQKIKAGQVVGVMGNTGNSSGPHLHIELQYASDWGYAKNLRNPNDYIDWNNCGGKAANEGGYEMFVWKNGSTSEDVYNSVTGCRTKKGKIDTLPPRATATCTATVEGCRLIYYATAGGEKRCGFVAYHGGVK